MKAARTVMAGWGLAVLVVAACSGADPPGEGAVPGRATTTLVLAPASTTVTTAAPRPSTTQAPEPEWTRYASATYKVALAYPPNWSEPADGTASAPTFFALSAASGGGQSLAETCRGAATHRLRPFGSNPMVRTDLTFGGQPACIIEPSPDQPADNRGMAQLMVRYPTPLQLRNDTYEILVVTAHNRFIPAIASTLSFV